MARRTNEVIEAVDGYRLEVTGYLPIGGGHFSGVAVINSGAGIPKSLYEPFATWLADHGIPTFTYDYRGIGGSRGASLKSLSATIRDWGSKDCAGVLRHVRSLYPEAEVHVVAHSIGGIVTGFVTTPTEIGRLLFISPHTGYLGDYAPSSRLKMFILWHFLMPFLTRIFGYFPGRKLGLPEDLPAGVAIEWGTRRFSWSVKSDNAYGTFSHIEARALCLRPSDDLFATSSALRRVESLFAAAHFTDLTLAMKSGSGDHIGHFGFFHPRYREQLWPVALAWLAAGTIEPWSVTGIS